MRQVNIMSGVIVLGLSLQFLVATSVAQDSRPAQHDKSPDTTSSASGKTFRVYWDHGLRLQTVDKDVDLKLGGRLQMDWNWTWLNDELEAAFGDPEARFFVRRAWLSLGGTLYKYIGFQLTVDFAGGDVTFEDTYIRFQHLPYVGSLTVGKFVVPFSLERLTSDLFTTFQERSLTLAFVPGLEIGFLLHNAVLHHRITWAVAGTLPTDNDSTLSTAGSGDDWSIAVRLTGLPWYENQGERLVHLGFAYTFRNFPDEMTSYSTSPEAEIKNTAGDSIRFVDTGSFGAQRGSQIGAEAALVYGPFALQGEYMWVFGLIADGQPAATTTAIEDVTFSAWYMMTSYFMTGEHRPYKSATGVFGRPIPKHNLGRGGSGAWEVAFRVSHVDLHDAAAINGPSAGGKELNLTFGVNWYPNPNTRVTLNYVTGWVDDRVVTGVPLDNSTFGVVMMRFQVDL